MFTEFDERMMRRALALSRRGEGWVEPNPMVGCVIVRDGRVVGEGFHRRFGAAHAEVEALRRCGGKARRATVFVTLEPCGHFGKTPPCADALIDAGVRRVVVAARDPNPLVAGRGLRRLRSAGIEVVTDVRRDEAAEVLAPFFTCMVDHRPYVIAKWAQSLDGKLVTRAGQSKWISGEASRSEGHKLRARVDAVLVGAGTVLCDDPQLTARGVRVRRVATRVVLDGRLRISERSHLVRSAKKIPVLVFTTSASSAGRKAERLRRAGVEIVPVPAARSGLNLDRILADLAARGVTNLLVEGGPTVLAAFFAGGWVDEAWVFTAPRFIGGRAASGVFERMGAIRGFETPVPSHGTVRRIGEDVMHRLRFTRPPTG